MLKSNQSTRSSEGDSAMTEEAIRKLAVDMFDIVRHKDVHQDTEYVRNGRVIVLTPFDGAYTMIGATEVRVYDYDLSWAVIADRIRDAA